MYLQSNGLIYCDHSSGLFDCTSSSTARRCGDNYTARKGSNLIMSACRYVWLWRRRQQNHDETREWCIPKFYTMIGRSIMGEKISTVDSLFRCWRRCRIHFTLHLCSHRLNKNFFWQVQTCPNPSFPDSLLSDSLPWRLVLSPKTWYTKVTLRLICEANRQSWHGDPIFNLKYANKRLFATCSDHCLFDAIGALWRFCFVHEYRHDASDTLLGGRDKGRSHCNAPDTLPCRGKSTARTTTIH